MAGRPARLQVDIVTQADTRGVDQAESKLGRLGSTAGKLGKLAAGGLAIGLGAAAAAGFKLAQAAAEDEQGAARLAKTLENTTGATRRQVGAVEDWITAQGRQLGVADDELRPALQRLVTATGDVAEGQKLASLAMDLSAGTGKSLEAVSTALAKAQDGNVAGLSRLGAETKNAAGETKTFEQLTRELAKTHEGQASTAANTSAGKWGRVKLQFGELGETIGSKLLPMASKVGEWALQMLPKAERLGRQVGKVLGPAFADVGAFITDKALPAGRRFGDWIMDTLVPAVQKYATPIINGARTAFGKIADAIERNREPLGKVAGLVKSLAEKFLNDFMPIVGKVTGKGFEVIGTAVGVLIDSLGWLIDKIDSVIDKLQSLRDWIAKIDMPDFNVPFVGGTVGGMTAGVQQLAGGTSEFPGARIATASSPLSSWGAFASAAGAGQLQRASMIDARTILTVNVDGSGIVDEVRVADQLAGVLTRHAQRLGRPVVGLGV